MRISYDPTDLESVNAVFFPNDRKAFVISDGKNDSLGDARINMKRFIDAEGFAKIRSEYRLDRKLADAFLASATDALSKAGKYHFVDNITEWTIDENSELWKKEMSKHPWFREDDLILYCSKEDILELQKQMKVNKTLLEELMEEHDSDGLIIRIF